MAKPAAKKRARKKPPPPGKKPPLPGRDSFGLFAQGNVIGNLASKYPGDEEALRLTVEVMGTGGTKAMLAVKMGVTRRCIELWQNNNETFRAIMDVGETLAQSWFEGVGLDGLQGNSLNANHWKFFMTTRFKEDYVERTNLTVTGVEALLAEIHDRGEKLLSAG